MASVAGVPDPVMKKPRCIKHPAVDKARWKYVPVYNPGVGVDDYWRQDTKDAIGQLGYGAKLKNFTAHCWYCGERCEGNHKSTVKDGLAHLLAWL